MSTLTNYLSDIANAIREKKGTSASIPAQNFSTEIRNLNTSGITPNGIIESYYAYAGENISAGDFVEFINGVATTIDYGESAKSIVAEGVNYNNSSINSFLIDYNKIVVFYEATNLCGAILKIEGTTITVEQVLTIYEGSIPGDFSPVRLSNGNFFIVFPSRKSGSYYPIHGVIVNLENDLTISLGTDTVIYSKGYGTNNSVTVLPNDDIFVTCVGSSSTYLYGFVARIEEGTLVTSGTAVKLRSTNGYNATSLALSNESVLVTYNIDKGGYELGAMVVSISDLTVTAGTHVQLTTVEYTGSGAWRLLKISENRILIITKGTYQSYYLYGIIIEIDGTTITVKAEAQLSDVATTGNNIAIQQVENNKFAIIHNYSSYYQLYYVILTVEGYTMSIGTDTMLDGGYYNGYFLTLTIMPNDILLATNVDKSSNVNQPLYARLVKYDKETDTLSTNIINYEYETQVKLATNNPFNGIAKTSGTGGTETQHNEQIDIYTL